MGRNPEANQLPPSQGRGAVWGSRGFALGWDTGVLGWDTGMGYWDGAALRAVPAAGGSSSRHQPRIVGKCLLLPLPNEQRESL